MSEDSQRLQELQKVLGYIFASPALLKQALTHRSCGPMNNERLEYLGDAFLNFTLASFLYEDSSLCQGQLSRARAYLVSKERLIDYASLINLSSYLQCAQRQKISEGAIADAFEALLGSLVLDAGYLKAKSLFFELFASTLEQFRQKALQKDPKTLLQEISQKHFKTLPQYTLIKETGRGHRLIFHVQCKLAGYQTEAEKTSLKSAQLQAAQKMLKVIEHDLKK